MTSERNFSLVLHSLRLSTEFSFVRDVAGLVTRRMVMTKGLYHNFRLFGNACSTFGLVKKKYETSDGL